MEGKEQPLFYQKQPFGVRLTSQEIDFVTENFDELFDGDRDIQPRKAFMLLIEKALYKISKAKDSQPADLLKINELEKELSEVKARNLELSTGLNSAVELKTDAERRFNEAVEELQLLRENPQVKEVEKPVIKDRELLPTERLLQLTPLESFILAQIETVHNTDAKGVLIDRFFMLYQKRGNGDFDIKRISPRKMEEIVNHFKANQ